MEQETQKEFGKLLIDVAKYIITAIVVSSFFKAFGETWLIYVVGGLIATLLLTWGFFIYNQAYKKTHNTKK